MSVTLTLYKVVKNVDYLGKLEDKVKWSLNEDSELCKLEESYGYKANMTPEEETEYNRKIIESTFSDGKKHEIFDVRYLELFWKNTRGFKRFKKTLSRIDTKLFKNVNGYTYKYVVTDIVEYRQGWELKKRFFKKEITTVVCTNKKQLERFFDRYLDLRKEQAREWKNTFLSKFEDGMIFECSW